jgi:cardiolipin synthase
LSRLQPRQAIFLIGKRGISESKERLLTVPNVLTMTRMATAPLIGYWVMMHQYEWAFGGLVLGGISDVLDGYIARKWNMKSVVGSVLDPAADKVLVTVLTVTLAQQGLLPMPLAWLILGRDAGLVVSALYIRHKSLSPPKTWRRYWDVTIPSVEVRPTTVSKVNTAFQLLLVSSTLAASALDMAESAQMVLTGLQWSTGVTTLWSGLQYTLTKDGVRYLKP